MNEANELENMEVMFQCSLKFPLVRNLLGIRADRYFAYTNQSWWLNLRSGLAVYLAAGILLILLVFLSRWSWRGDETPPAPPKPT